MSSAEDVQAWFDAVQLYDDGNIEEAIQKFRDVTSNSKMLFDIGCCYLRINNVNSAIQNYQAAVDLDRHMAIGYFMLGLTNYLKKNYEKSMMNFEESLSLLRGNRFVDYKQLGLKYQLYSCEILTNQAVIAYSQNKLGQAKGLLLQAVGCKAEKRHESIVDILSMLQAGYPITPFIPPQSEIFRPPKAAVDNLKKKNYLGKSKVISTENTDEIYACFSGLKETQTKQVQNKPQAASRNVLLSELRLPGRKKSLRATPRPPSKQLPEFKLGRVIEGPPSKRLPPAPPRSSLPPAPSSTLPQRGRLHSPPSQSLPKPSNLPPKTSSLPPKTALPRPPKFDMNNNENEKNRNIPSKPPRVQPCLPSPRKPIPNVPDEQENYEAVLQSPTEEYNALGFTADSDGDDEVYEEIDDDDFHSRRPPPVPSSSRPGLSTNPLPNKRPNKALPPVRPVSQEVTANRERKTSNLSKPERAPPPPPAEVRKISVEENKEERRGSGSVVIPPRRYFPRKSIDSSENEFVREIKNFRPAANGKPPNIGRKNEVEDREATELPGKVYQEYEVQFTFVQRLQVPEDASLSQLQSIVKAQKIPERIELCYNDDLGRQQTLTDSNINVVLKDRKKKLFCFPSS